jgi:hypothetical protein
MAKSVYSMAQGLQKRPSEIVGGFGHPIKDFLFDLMLFNEFTTDDKGNIKRNREVNVDELIKAHEQGFDELAIAEMLGVKVVRRNPSTH